MLVVVVAIATGCSSKPEGPNLLKEIPMLAPPPPGEATVWEIRYPNAVDIEANGLRLAAAFGIPLDSDRGTRYDGSFALFNYALTEDGNVDRSKPPEFIAVERDGEWHYGIQNEICNSNRGAPQVNLDPAEIERRGKAVLAAAGAPMDILVWSADSSCSGNLLGSVVLGNAPVDSLIRFQVSFDKDWKLLDAGGFIYQFVPLGHVPILDQGTATSTEPLGLTGETLDGRRLLVPAGPNSIKIGDVSASLSGTPVVSKASVEALLRANKD